MLILIFSYILLALENDLGEVETSCHFSVNFYNKINISLINIVRFLLVISEVFKQIREASLGNSLNLNYV